MSSLLGRTEISFHCWLSGVSLCSLRLPALLLMWLYLSASKDVLNPQTIYLSAFSSAPSQRKLNGFQGSGDYTGPIWIIQDNIPTWRSVVLHNHNNHEYSIISQVLGLELDIFGGTLKIFLPTTAKILHSKEYEMQWQSDTDLFFPT